MATSTTTGIFTPSQMQQILATDPCPPWQRINVVGNCVDEWWAGGTFNMILKGVCLAAAIGALGYLAILAEKHEGLKPFAQFSERLIGPSPFKRAHANKRKRSRTRQRKRARRYCR